MQNMLEMLKQQYPAQMMPELARQTQGSLEDMLGAFPNRTHVPKAHLHGLVSAVEALLRISDYQRRRILHHMKRSKSRCFDFMCKQCTSKLCCLLVAADVSMGLVSGTPRSCQCLGMAIQPLRRKRKARE